MGSGSRRTFRKSYESWRLRTKESKIFIATLFAMCEGDCPECGCHMFLSFNREKLGSPYRATLDHITPLAEVKEHSKFGLRIMCQGCNKRLGVEFNKEKQAKEILNQKQVMEDKND